MKKCCVAEKKLKGFEIKTGHGFQTRWIPEKQKTHCVRHSAADTTWSERHIRRKDAKSRTTASGNKSIARSGKPPAAAEQPATTSIDNRMIDESMNNQRWTE